MSLPESLGEQLLPVLDRLAQTLNDRHVSYALIGGLGSNSTDANALSAL